MLDYSSFRKDPLVGERSINIAHVLQHYNGRLEFLELSMDLLANSKSENRQTKSGELVAVLNGLKLDMSKLVITNGSNGAGAAAGAASLPLPLGADNGGAGRSCMIYGGVRARMRLRNTNGMSTSENGAISRSPGSNGLERSGSSGSAGMRRSTVAGAVWEQQQQQQQAQQMPAQQQLQRLPAASSRQMYANGAVAGTGGATAAGAGNVVMPASPQPMMENGGGAAAVMMPVDQTTGMPLQQGNALPVSNVADQQLQVSLCLSLHF